MQFENITQEHLPELIELYIEAFNAPPWNDQWTHETATKRLSSMIGHLACYGLVAKEEGTVVGMILGYEEQFYDGVMFEIKEFCVHPAQGRKGYGTQILKEFEEQLKGKGITQVVLLTARDESTQGFYKKCGFKDYDEMVTMGKKF